MTNKLIYRVTIKADYNDGDYVYEILNLSEFEFDDIHPLLTRIALALEGYRNVNYNWPAHEGYDMVYKQYEDILSIDDINTFRNYVPSAENGIHSIVSIDVEAIHIINTIKIL